MSGSLILLLGLLTPQSFNINYVLNREFLSVPSVITSTAELEINPFSFKDLEDQYYIITVKYLEEFKSGLN